MENSQYRCDRNTEISEKESPVVEGTVLIDELQCLLAGAKHHEELLKTLGERQCEDCKEGGLDRITGQTEKYNRVVCQYNDCPKYLEQSIRNRLASSVSTALAAYGAVEHLNRLYQNCLERQCDLEQDAHDSAERSIENQRKCTKSSNGLGLDQGTLAFLDSTLESEQNDGKHDTMDETLMEFATNDTCVENQVQPISPANYRLGKDKVSKWTKVKAAFKWERADLVTLAEATKEYEGTGVDRMPHNREVARYLRVPVVTHGGSSPESMVSSSSGPLLSETGDTPGTISLASSMEDINDSSSHSKTLNIALCVDQCVLSSEEGNVEKPKCSKEVVSTALETRLRQISSDICPLSEACNEFRVPNPKCMQKVRIPPKPLILDFKQDLNDLDGSFSGTQVLKSPHKVSSAVSNRVRKISSPGNSSVPSSPSRNSDVFAEFGELQSKSCGGKKAEEQILESEDFSSGEFSEPSTPNGSYGVQRTQEEINRRYQILQKKLDKEFAVKQREWEKQKTNANSCRAINLKTSPIAEELSPKPMLGSAFCADFLEENLTPDFKKKLRKWRVKKQTTTTDGRLSPSSAMGQFPLAPVSSSKDKSTDPRSKTDWHPWKMVSGADQKNLPEEFQRKLDQWDKMKRNGDSFKRCGKSSAESGFKKATAHEKEALERLAKFKTAAAEVEVKTSIGVIKFEGISRKFTRKLYEWEKSRGIGPESSTFALLHPGYCPIDVDQISKDCCKNAEHSPTISRSLSLDSVAPNSMACGNSQRASSLSLNNINELRDLKSAPTANDFTGDAFKKILRPEPEAVMVEVEDDIVETAKHLITTHSLIEKEIPVYKYEQVSCNDYCNSKRVQSFESFTNLAPLLSVLKHTDEVLCKLKKTSPDIMENVEIRHCVESLTYIRLIYPHYTKNLMKPTVLNAITDVQAELERITSLSQRSPLDEACCREIMEERNCEFNEEFMGLRESLELLKSSINGGSSRYHLDIVPDINITSEDGLDSSAYAPTTVEASTDDFTYSEQVANHNGNIDAASVGMAGATMGSKKKLRMRKIGSRQNSKTESSDSSDTESSGIIDTPRRLKRKNFRTKPRSFEEPELLQKRECDPISNVMYGLKVNKPPSGNIKPIESPNDQQLPPIMTNSTVDDVECYENSNVFVKTKRKVFTTIKAPSSINGIAVIECDIEVLPASELELPTVLEEESETMGKHEDCRIWRPLRKSFSADGFQRTIDRPIERCRCVSAEHLHKLSDAPPKPLASDSLQIIEKSIPKLSYRSIVATQTPKSEMKPHLFKKNTEKSNSGATLKKIGSKIVKSFQSHSRDVCIEEGTRAEKSNEHAQRLQKAKDHLLQTIYGSDGPCSSREVRRVSCSDIHRPGGTMSCATQDVPSEDKENLLKSVSADAFNPTAQRHMPSVGHNAGVVTRSAKLSSKLGFANLASRFRRVKGKKVLDTSTSSNANSTLPKEGALSTLCRQSLLADGVALPMHFNKHHNGPSDAVKKSHSSPIAAAATEEHTEDPQVDIRPENYDNRLLNKSQSEQLVMNRNRSLI